MRASNFWLSLKCSFLWVNFCKASATPAPEMVFKIHLSICSFKWHCSLQLKFGWSRDIVKHQSSSQPGFSNKLCSYKKKVYFEWMPSSIKHLSRINGLQKLEKFNKRPKLNKRIKAFVRGDSVTLKLFGPQIW